METKVYVDVLLVINYIISLLLVLCTAKLTGRRPKRRRIVAAALFGSASALTIFLPFFGFWAEFFLRLVLAGAIVRIAFPYRSHRHFAKQLFVFFAVSFFFSGAMLALWITLSPSGMIYYNGIVYFDISSLFLIVCTIVAYGALMLTNRFSRGGRVKTQVYKAQIFYQDRMVILKGLVDTGNRLYEPFSDTPVMVCGLESLTPVLPPGVADAIRGGEHLTGELANHGFPFRMIPFENVGGSGLIPAFRPDRLILTESGGHRHEVQDVYIGIAVVSIGGAGYNAILNPDLIAVTL